MRPFGMKCRLCFTALIIVVTIAKLAEVKSFRIVFCRNYSPPETIQSRGSTFSGTTLRPLWRSFSISSIVPRTRVAFALLEVQQEC